MLCELTIVTSSHGLLNIFFNSFNPALHTLKYKKNVSLKKNVNIKLQNIFFLSCLLCRMSYQQFINHLTAVHNIIFSCEIITFLKRLSDNQGIFVLNFAALAICPNTFHHFYSTDM